MTCPGTIVRSVAELEALNPGAVLVDADGDNVVRTPDGWRYTPGGKTTWESAVLLSVCGPLTLEQPSPMDAMLADPVGQQLVQDIHDRQVHKQITRPEQLDALPVGTVVRDRDGDKACKLEDGWWDYTKLAATLEARDIARTFAPLQVVVQP